MLTKSKASPSQERVKQAREEARRVEEQRKNLRQQLAEHSKATEAQRAEWRAYRERGGHVDFAFYPSRAEGTARGYRQSRLESEIRGAERALTLACERLADAERLAKPLSRPARERLAELARWATADAELAERLGVNPCELYMSGAGGKDQLLAFAAEHGIEVDR